MTDFIEYVVSELRQKRLSKPKALALIRQFSSRKNGAAATLHPLVHRNISDLQCQEYSVRFSGAEFFLQDHRLRHQPVLPGAAYVEMIRAAFADASRQARQGYFVCENLTWETPVIVQNEREVHIALEPAEGERCAVEIFTPAGTSEETVHCAAHCHWSEVEPDTDLKVASLQSRLQSGRLEKPAIYQAFARMGMHYGPAHQGLEYLVRGATEVLGSIHMPGLTRDAAEEFVLHPAVLDCAFQAALGFSDDLNDLPADPTVPYGLQRLVVWGPCETRMWVWMRRRSPELCQEGEEIFDLYLFNNAGQACVQIDGFITRRLSSHRQETQEIQADYQTLLARPVWQVFGQGAPAAAAVPESARSLVLIADKLFTHNSAAAAQVIRIAENPDAAALVAEIARQALACLREYLRGAASERHLLQVVLTAHPASALLWRPLHALLQTANTEQPRLRTQLIWLTQNSYADQLPQRLAQMAQVTQNAFKIDAAGLQVAAWEELSSARASCVWKEDGVYLITGGRGALGRRLAIHILQQTRRARVILAGRQTLDDSAWRNFLAQHFSDCPDAEARLQYYAWDLADRDSVAGGFSLFAQQGLAPTGILHCAGATEDGFLLAKDAESFQRVMAPKVSGTLHLDAASRGCALDFFVCFSSVAGALGNSGQGDYAFANGFMDAYMAERQRAVADGKCQGRSLAINWPWWADGGIALNAGVLDNMRRQTGMQALPTEVGLQVLAEALVAGDSQWLVFYGEAVRLVQRLANTSLVPTDHGQEAAATTWDETRLAEQAGDFVKRLFADILKIPAHRLEMTAPLEKYGIDSILAMSLTSALEVHFGALSKTLFFEYQTLAELVAYLVRDHRATLLRLLDLEIESSVVQPSPQPQLPAPARRQRGRRRAATREAQDFPVAIVGLSGRYPQAKNIAAFWENLVQGRDCITEVPEQRWNWRRHYSADRSKAGHHFSKWGGFIDGAEYFDPLFFNISPLEAETIDPQERLFLQHVWLAIEDAGYTRERLQIPHDDELAAQVGVYAGVMYSEYPLVALEANRAGVARGVGGSNASIANRVSYFLNLHGPCMTVDTMCSSSLTAIHLACEDLKQGRTDLAIAGGVNLSLHPNKYQVLSDGRFISSEGQCQSFGAGGDGYIPGEGVGVVILQRLADAEREGNHIYAVIKGTALNHGGKTNGYSVPNPQAQSSVIHQALKRARVDPRHISYLEAHGTGTKLGDPIEIAALTQAFSRNGAREPGFCSIGSAKSNIGHCESAAGVAGLTKILLQMAHGKIVPSLHAETLNPNIDFARTPFVVNRSLCDWEAPILEGRSLPRIAGISSFGAGGSNAHLIVEEYAGRAPVHVTAGPYLIVLSARTPEQLDQRAAALLEFIEQGSVVMVDLAFTLQVGREAMGVRLACQVRDQRHLLEVLQQYCRSATRPDGVFVGAVNEQQEVFRLINQDDEVAGAAQAWVKRGKWEKLLELWVQGLAFDWRQLYVDARPNFISLPTYPFAEQAYWLEPAAENRPAAVARMHPLLHENHSDFSRQIYRSFFDGSEFFLRDHSVQNARGELASLLPASAYIELIHAALCHAWPGDAQDAEWSLENLQWLAPLWVGAAATLALQLELDETLLCHFEVRAGAADAAFEEGELLCRGQAVRNPSVPAVATGFSRLGVDAGEVIAAEAIYRGFARIGLHYGPAHQTLSELVRGQHEIRAQLRLPAAAAGAGYFCHPAMLDGALQACVAMDARFPTAEISLPVPFAVAQVKLFAPVPAAAEVRIRQTAQGLDIDINDPDGKRLVELRGLSSRSLTRAAGPTLITLYGIPEWRRPGATVSAPRPQIGEAVFLVDLPAVDGQLLRDGLSLLHCEQLDCTAQSPAEFFANAADTLANYCRARLAAGEKQRLTLLVSDSEQGRLATGFSGFLKSVSQEFAGFSTRILQVPQTALVQDVMAIFQAAASVSGELLRSRDGALHVATWQLHERLPVAVDVHSPSCVLVTGGLGGLGRIVARDLVRKDPAVCVVLTGRRALTEDEWQTMAAEICADAQQRQRLIYRAVDFSDQEQARAQLAGLVREFADLDGVIHSAGMTRDGLLLHKSVADFQAVLQPKVASVALLDELTAERDLRFFVLFSSIAAVFGNPGQSDYACANGFLDAFAEMRNHQVRAGQRRGQTLSINWPLWANGGMNLPAPQREALARATGMWPMPDDRGVAALWQALAQNAGQVMVLHGDAAQLHQLFAAPERQLAENVVAASQREAISYREAINPPKTIDQRENATQRANADAQNPAADLISESDIRLAEVESWLAQRLAGELKIPAAELRGNTPLDQYGIDSIVAMRLTASLEETFGELAKTLFFEYQTLGALAQYFHAAHRATLLRHMVRPKARPAVAAAPAAAAVKTAKIPGKWRGPLPARTEDIAIIGLSGRYPEAESLAEFWDNLRSGRDCIREIPAQRWPHAHYFDERRNQPGKSYSRWGGFLAGVDEFDPIFFSISPKEAELLDPQERLFLETAWTCCEDAGYSRAALSGSRIGVYVGVMWGHYELYGTRDVTRTGVPSSSFASVANRVSYFFNWSGPSMAVDTMCSSSSTAIHLAVEALRQGDLDAALAGGVNVSIHPHKYVNLSQGNFASSDGRCRSFGAGGDGYVPGEGVGAVLLKTRSRAERDGDHIYALIKASALNHGGKTNGYTVPNPAAQAEVIARALGKAKVDPATISYVETHGTGTALGDPIEIRGLAEAFGARAADSSGRRCAIGSVKSNIGHLESAAGIAALTKVILQMRHRQLVPSLHAESLNPNIDFSQSHFQVQTQLAPWRGDGESPLRAGISSFGAGGANAHLVLESYVDTPSAAAHTAPLDRDLPVVLSAREPATLVQCARRLLQFLAQTPEVSFTDLVYTLQEGRSTFTYRLAVMARDGHSLAQRLEQWCAAPETTPEKVFATARDVAPTVRQLLHGDAGEAYLKVLLANGDIERLASLWADGVAVDWTQVRGAHPDIFASARRIALPTYPFNKARYWLDIQWDAPMLSEPSHAGENAVLPQWLTYEPRWEVQAQAERPLAAGTQLLCVNFDAELYTSFSARVAPQQPLRAQLDGAGHFAEGAREDRFGKEDTFGTVAGQLDFTAGPIRILWRLTAMDNTALLRMLLGLTQALLAGKPQYPCELLVFVPDTASGAAPQFLAVNGFLKTLYQENPRFPSRFITWEGAAVTADTLAAQLVRELAVPAQQAKRIAIQVNSHDNPTQRRVEVFRPLAAAPTAAPTVLKQGGIYLISGGLGGLGYIFAEYLARQYGARLILLGRSSAGDKQREQLARLRQFARDVRYYPVDITDLAALRTVVAGAAAELGGLDGVIHSAGAIRDAFILHKTPAEMQAVAVPKLQGTDNLDLATAGWDLDFFALFTSLAGITGNTGQSDYAFANAYQRAFAARRASACSAGERRGRTLAIHWPYWADGGMQLSAADMELSRSLAGIYPLSTDMGLAIFERRLADGAVDQLDLVGVPALVENYLNPPAPAADRAEPGAPPASAAQLPALQNYLLELLGGTLKLSAARLDPQESFANYGLDSVMINQINVRFAQDFGDLPKTLLYEYDSVARLSEYLLAHESAAVNRLLPVVRDLQRPEPDNSRAMHAAEAAHAPAHGNLTSQFATVQRDVTAVQTATQEIAIIGIHGRYPGADNLAEFWQNLVAGRDAVGEIPADRWDWRQYFDADPAHARDGKIYCKWGGFLQHHDKFDAEFFQISAVDAAIMDPQERLFMESVWSAFEDAGYTRETLRATCPQGRGANVGVFVGVTTNSYQVLAPEAQMRGVMATPNAMPWSIANRVSYFFDFQGPSLPVDTACSSSLVALHLACKSLRDGECAMAVAGGVNLYLHPSKYQSFCQRRMISTSGHNCSYGAGDDGFVPGEGLGTLILKPLAAAQRDGDHIYAVVRGSAVEHAGRSHGYSAPNPNAQADVIAKALRAADATPATIDYIEGHGTGTQMGDSLEVTAIGKAFAQWPGTAKSRLGSVKSNVGHAESAAGVCGITKIILQMQHDLLVPSLHSGAPNPQITFAQSTCVLQQEAAPWSAEQPRRALINSFGAGGVNAAVVLADCADSPLPAAPGPQVVVLSARNRERLRALVSQWLDFLKNPPSVRLLDLAYTLQVGREAFASRLACVVDNYQDLATALRAWFAGDASLVWEGELSSQNPRAAQPAATDPREVARAWTQGLAVDWRGLHGLNGHGLHDRAPLRRVSLPTYAFARTRHWITADGIAGNAPATTALHPLVTRNCSTLKQVAFEADLQADAYYATDHVIHGQRLLPGAAFLEIACVAGGFAAEQKVTEIRDLVFAAPLVFQNDRERARVVLKTIGDYTEFEIISYDPWQAARTHSEGRLQFGNARQLTPPPDFPLADLLRAGKPREDFDVYALFRTLGFDYGKGFQVLRQFYQHADFHVAELRLPQMHQKDFDQYYLHPALLDGALQAVAGSLQTEAVPQGQVYLPFAIESLQLFRPLASQLFVLIKPADPARGLPRDMQVFDLWLCNAKGEVLAALQRFYLRALATATQAVMPSAT